jgi:hypothetical protein
MIGELDSIDLKVLFLIQFTVRDCAVRDCVVRFSGIRERCFVRRGYL